MYVHYTYIYLVCLCVAHTYVIPINNDDRLLKMSAQLFDVWVCCINSWGNCRQLKIQPTPPWHPTDPPAKGNPNTPGHTIDIYLLTHVQESVMICRVNWVSFFIRGLLLINIFIIKIKFNNLAFGFVTVKKYTLSKSLVFKI